MIRSNDLVTLAFIQYENNGQRSFQHILFGQHIPGITRVYYNMHINNYGDRYKILKYFKI